MPACARIKNLIDSNLQVISIKGDAVYLSEKKKMIKCYYEYVDKKELDKLFSLFSDDIVYKRPGIPEIVGKEEFRRFYREKRMIEKGKHTVTNIIVEKDIVATQGFFKGTLKNGKSIQIGFAEFFIFKNGKICRRYSYTDLGKI